jgi:hypothetical protein
MKKLSCTLLIISATLLGNLAYCQKADSEKQAQIEYIAKDLSISNEKAGQVVLILDQYKAKAKSIINDKALPEAERRVKFDLAIDEKNISLTKLLTLQQLQKIIPSTEKRKDKPAGNGSK